MTTQRYATMSETVARTQPATPRVGSVLVVGPGPRGRGGISSVIRMHQRTPTWNKRRTLLLPTFDDRSAFHKIKIALTAYLLAPYRLLHADLLHLHLAAQTSMMRKLPILVMARLLKRPVIVHVHAPSPESLFNETPSWLLRFVFRSAARVVALSQSWADVFASYEPRTRIVVLANPVRRIDPVEPKPGTPPVILFVGKLEARKGYSDLLAAVPEVLSEFSDAQFWFAGQGELEAARKQSEQLGIAGSIRLLGWVEGADLDSIYRQARIAVLPSYAEGVPMSIIEAMSYGIPVVCTPVGGLPELIVDGENGLFVEPGDIRSLARQVSRLLREPNFAKALGVAGRAEIQQHCSVEDVSEALDALYSDVLGENAKYHQCA